MFSNSLSDIFLRASIIVDGGGSGGFLNATKTNLSPVW
jgi:hypothetical protein